MNFSLKALSVNPFMHELWKNLRTPLSIHQNACLDEYNNSRPKNVFQFFSTFFIFLHVYAMDNSLTLFLLGGGWFSPPSQFFIYNFWSIHSYTFKFCDFSKLLFESIMGKNFFGKYAAVLPW